MAGATKKATKVKKDYTVYEEDVRHFRFGLIIAGAFVTLTSPLGFPWFTIIYQPPGYSYSFKINYDLHTQITYVLDGASVKAIQEYFLNVFLCIAFSFLYLFLIGIFTNEKIQRFLHGILFDKLLAFGAITGYLYAVYNTANNKTMIRSLTPQALEKYFGTTDLNYIIKNCTIELRSGFYIGAVAVLAIAIGMNIPSSFAMKVPLQVLEVAFILPICSCCSFGLFDIVHGFAWGNNFYDNAHHFTVKATLGWQEPTLNLKQGDAVWIYYLPHTGQWTADKSSGLYSDAGGRTSQVKGGGANLPMPDFSSQALIAKIGDDAPIFVGNSISFLAPHDGALALRMNQADNLLGQGDGAIQVLIGIYRWDSGRTISTATVTLQGSADWQDTNIQYDQDDIIGIAYQMHSGSWPNSNALVASDNQNGRSPDYLFIHYGVYNTGSPLPPVRPGLIAKIGENPPFYCGYSIIAKNLSSKDSSHIQLKLNDPMLTAGTLKVTIIKIHLDTVSTSIFV